MLELFEFNFSVEGSNAKEAEEATVVHCNEFLTEVEKEMASKKLIKFHNSECIMFFRCSVQHSLHGWWRGSSSPHTRRCVSICDWS